MTQQQKAQQPKTSQEDQAGISMGKTAQTHRSGLRPWRRRFSLPLVPLASLHSERPEHSTASQQTVPVALSYAFSIILPPYEALAPGATFRDAVQLFSSITLSKREPVAFEIVGEVSRQLFIMRATTEESLAHLRTQILARYPQARLRSLVPAHDPWRLHANERCVGVVLRPGAASYQSLRLPIALASEGTRLPREEADDDPLLGVLAALTDLPPGMRAISQLALQPTPDTWSRSFWRKAVEHPLEPERRAEQRARATTGGRETPGLPTLVALGVLASVLLLWRLFGRTATKWLPGWVQQDGVQVLRGHLPALTFWQWGQLIGTGVCVLLLLLGLTRLLTLLQRTAPLYDMRAVAAKTRQIASLAQVRLLIIAPQTASQVHCETRLTRLIAAYRAYHQASGNYFVPQRLSAWACRCLFAAPSRWRRHASWSRHLARQALVLSMEELAALWHLPRGAARASLAYLERHGAHTMLVPHALATAALAEPAAVRIGISEHGDASVPVCLPSDLLRRNLLAVASTGKGKSTLLTHLAAARLAHMHRTAQEVLVAQRVQTTVMASLLVLEPHGDLIHTLIGLIPPTLWERVVLVDLAEETRCIGLNPLDMTAGRSRDKAVDDLITLFKHLWEEAWGPRTENILEYALRTLTDANEYLLQTVPDGAVLQYTLLDVVPLLRLTNFRHAVFALVTDEALLDWWHRYYEPLDKRFQLEIISSVVTKLSKYSSSRLARRMLGQPYSTFSLREAIARGSIILVNTASGIVGTDLSALVGTTFLGLFQAALAEQAALPVEQRHHTLVLIDEFQTYHGTDYVRMLAELRKYGGTFGLATQSLAYLDQLDRTLRPTVLANIDHLYAFEMAAEDARLLMPELEGVSLEDLTNLPDYTCYAKLSLAGQRLPVFSLRLDAPPALDAFIASQVRRRSLERTTRPVAEIDAYLAQQRLERGERRKQELPLDLEHGNDDEQSVDDQQAAVGEDRAGNSTPMTVSSKSRAEKTSRKQSADISSGRRRSRGGRRKKQDETQAAQEEPVTPLTTPDGSMPLVETVMPPVPPDRVEWTGPADEGEREGRS